MKDKISLPLLASIAALTPLAVDMYLAAIPAIAEDLNTSINVIQNSLSIFLLGFGLGMLFFGPCSDRFGRRPIVLTGLIGATLTSFFITLSTSTEMFLILRLLQGFLGSAATVVVRAMVRDCYGKDTAKGMSTMSMIMLLAPLIAPLVGSFLLSLGSWQIIFHVLTAYALIVLTIAFWRIEETKPDNDKAIPYSFLGNYRIILSKRAIHLDLVCFALTSFAFFTYLTSASFMYITYFGVSEARFGILFATTASALIFANFINMRIVSHFGSRKLLKAGIVIGTFFSALLILVNFLQLNVYWTLTCFIFIIGCLGISSINADALVLMKFPYQASSAAAVTGTLRFGTGALAGPALALVYTGTPIPIACLIFAALLTATGAQILRQRQGHPN